MAFQRTAFQNNAFQMRSANLGGSKRARIERLRRNQRPQQPADISDDELLMLAAALVTAGVLCH